jgi:hypothetical protein
LIEHDLSENLYILFAGAALSAPIMLENMNWIRGAALAQSGPRFSKRSCSIKGLSAVIQPDSAALAFSIEHDPFFLEKLVRTLL